MNAFAWLLPCIALAGCTDIIEKDLSGSGVVLRTPPDGDTTTSNVVTFKWDEVPHATEYQLQIATPDLDSPVSYAADTLIGSATISLPLAPGTYAWQVRARNSNSATEYFRRRLTVVQGSSLEELTPLLTAPAANAATADEPVVFQWQALAGAEDYRFELRTGDQTGPLVQAQIVAGTQLSVASLPEGSYTWGVQGQSASSSSLFAYRALRIDRTAPTAPLLIAPAAGATILHVGFDFQWQSGTDAGTVTDSLFVNDVNTVHVRAIPVAGGTYADSLANGTYTWWIRTTDAAGNYTDATSRSLTVQ